MTFTVSRAKSVDEAATEFGQFRQSAAVAVGTIGKQGQKTHEISGLGDEALWTPVPGGVYLRLVQACGPRQQRLVKHTGYYWLLLRHLA